MIESLGFISGALADVSVAEFIQQKTVFEFQIRFMLRVNKE